MANTALREAIRSAHLSQAGFAREIQRAGWRRGHPNGCNRAMVGRWCSGRTRRPQPRYLLLIEDVLGQPAGNLGFDADLQAGMNRAQAAADAGLDDPVFPLPEGAGHGPLTGIWLSSYSFTSSGRGADFTSRHYVIVLHEGARVMVRSLPQQASAVAMDLGVNGQIVTGTWTERTRGGGYYRGAFYTGAIQLRQKDDGWLDGTWVGFGKQDEINTGPWSLLRRDEAVTPEAVDRWDAPLGDPGEIAG